MKSIIFSIMILITAQVYSQNITGTLGTNGLFTVKDISAIFLTLKQSNGYLGIGISPNEQLEITKNFRLPYTTSSTVGVMYKGIDRFLHNYGTNNTFLGINSGNFSMTGANNTALGYQSSYTNTSGHDNSSAGYLSLYSNTTGYENTSTGSNSLYMNSSGFNNTALGYVALFNNSIGSGNTAVGMNSLYYTTSSNNTSVGSDALFSNSTGFNNTALGNRSGYSITTGSNLTLIGYNSAASGIAANNEVTLGNTSVTSLRCNVTSITSLSDMRDKKNITDLTLGLDFISKLKPRQFNWDKREWYDDNVSDGSKMTQTPTAGFIAQELDSAQVKENAEWLGLVYKDSPEKWEATYGNLLPVMVKAIQELKSENDKLRTEMDELKKENEKNKVRLAKN